MWAWRGRGLAEERGKAASSKISNFLYIFLNVIMQERTGAAWRGHGGGVTWWRGVAKQHQQQNPIFWISFKFDNARANRGSITWAWRGHGFVEGRGKKSNFLIYFFNLTIQEQTGAAWRWRGGGVVCWRGVARKDAREGKRKYWKDWHLKSSFISTLCIFYFFRPPVM